MKSRINVGVVGCGYWGPNLIRNFRSLPACRLKVMCDVNEGRLAHLHELYPEIQRETDYARLVEDPELHAIAIEYCENMIKWAKNLKDKTNA